MITNQLIYFFKSVALGVFIGIIFDVFKIIRLSVKHLNIVVFIEDLFFWIIASVLTYIFMMDVSLGQIRFFILVGELIGFVLYKLSVSSFFVGVISRIIKIVIKGLCLIYKFFILPIYKLVIKIFIIVFTPVINFLKKYLNIVKNLLKSKWQIVYNKSKREVNENIAS